MNDEKRAIEDVTHRTKKIAILQVIEPYESGKLTHF